MKRTVILLLLLTITYLAIDTIWPRTSNLRDFKPADVARLDTEMWQSYYDRKQAKLIWQLVSLFRAQYRASWVDATRMAYQAGRAAFVFKNGKTPADYERVIPYLETYFTLFERQSREPFDVRRAARTELTWWVVHRKRNPPALEKALADEMAVIYHQPARDFAGYAAYRTEAMMLRDSAAKTPAGVTAANWQTINELLTLSWQSAYRAVNQQKSPVS
ncbi:MAG: hypothetical protein H7Z72_23350 [Bacteroidetes bacterium]|nr:hypothetical protein [Fibrella sp.]